MGTFDEDNRPHGNDVLFLYPDLKTVLKGNYDHGKMTNGRLVTLTGVKYECGIVVPETKDSVNSPTYS